MANKENIAKKEAEVKELAEYLKSANLVLLIDYRGTTVDQDTKIRKSLREANATCKIKKNNILKRALNKNGITELDEVLVGPTAVIIAQEEYLPALKAIYNYSKEHDFYKMKAGVLEGKVTDISELKVLAQLPSREELIAKLAGCLLANVSKLAATLDAVRVKKESESAE